MEKVSKVPDCGGGHLSHRHHHRPVAGGRHHPLLHRHGGEVGDSGAVPGGGVSAVCGPELCAGHLLRGQQHHGRDPDGSGPVRRCGSHHHGGRDPLRCLFRGSVQPRLLGVQSGGGGDGYRPLSKRPSDAPYRPAPHAADAGGVRCSLVAQSAGADGPGGAGLPAGELLYLVAFSAAGGGDVLAASLQGAHQVGHGRQYRGVGDTGDGGPGLYSLADAPGRATTRRIRP